MLRVLVSILVASILSSLLFWLVVSLFSAYPLRVPGTYYFILFITMTCVLISLLGLPWLYLMKKKSMTKLWHASALGAVMGAFCGLVIWIIGIRGNDYFQRSSTMRSG